MRSLKKIKTSHTYHICYRHFDIKLLILQNKPVVQCDVPAVKNTSLDDGNNDNRK